VPTTVGNAPLLQFAERLLNPPCAFILVTELKRFYVQGGTIFANPEPTILGMSGNSITQTWCDTQKAVFNEKVYPFSEFGGMVSMGKGIRLGMVLVIGLWDDHYADMLWLDATYSTDGDPESLGQARGECDVMSGVPAEVPGAQVVFSNIKFGPIGSTFEQPA
jgi:cellulose 1,4-beta-cellobiosidase